MTVDQSDAAGRGVRFDGPTVPGTPARGAGS